MPLPLMERSQSMLWFWWSSLVLRTLLVLSMQMIVGWRASSNSNGPVGRVFRNLKLGNTRGEGTRWVHVELSVDTGSNKITGKVWFCDCLSRPGQLRNYLRNVWRLVSDGTWLQQLREECCALVKSLSRISECGDNSEVRLNVAQWRSRVVFRGESEALAEDQRGVES